MFNSIATSAGPKPGDKLPTDPPPEPIQVPKAFGVTLMASEIANNSVTFCWIFVNRTDKVVEITWLPKSQPFDFVITDAKGGSWHINDFMPPPPANSAPVSIQPNSESARVLVFQPSQIPGLDLVFDSSDAPYLVEVKLNSDSHVFSAKTGLKFA